MKLTNTVNVGGFKHVNAIAIGGNSLVVIQTMWKDRLSDSDLDEAVKRIENLSRMGCGLIRFSVPDLEAAQTLGALAQIVSMPLAADIHFDYKIALRCMDFPIAKIRINPGNIGGDDKVKAVLEKAGEKNIPIRIGVNAGSLPSDLRLKSSPIPQSPVPDPCSPGRVRALAESLVIAAERELAVFDKYNFKNVIVSMKASGLAETVLANRIFSQKSVVPLHIGVTEAGPLIAGITRSSAALAVLLSQGIGDTLRVSLSDSMENEIIAAGEICNAAAELASLDGEKPHITERLRRNGVTIISCPRCGRYGFDTHGFTGRWLPKLYSINKKLTVAVMGCEVNGPEEARHADLGITGSGNKVFIFRQGKIVRTVCADEADDAFAKELNLLH